MQTRKWTGTDGIEKYTTEVVLQRYRGDLTMLDRRGESFDSPVGDPSPLDSPEISSDSSSLADSPTQSDTGAFKDLDDDIPF